MPDRPNIFADVHALALDLAETSRDMAGYASGKAVTNAARENADGRAYAYMEAARRVQILLAKYKIEVDIIKPKTRVPEPGKLF